jgi:hypothetical protein
MEKILLSSLVGVITYFVLSAGTQFSDSKIDSLQMKGGYDSINSINNCDIFPECFMVSNNAKEIFEILINEKKCGTPEYDDLALLYSKMFCFEIALGNNPNHPYHVEKEKVKQLLRNYKQTINIEQVKYIKSNTFINDFINDININAKIVLDKLSVDKSIHEKHNELIEKHRKQIQDLYDNLKFELL